MTPEEYHQIAALLNEATDGIKYSREPLHEALRNLTEAHAAAPDQNSRESICVALLALVDAHLAQATSIDKILSVLRRVLTLITTAPLFVLLYAAAR